MTKVEAKKTKGKTMKYNGVEYKWLWTVRIKRVPIKEEQKDGN